MSRSHPYIPAGCTQQGRAEPAPPAPAEACTDVGHDEGTPVTGIDALKFWVAISAPALGGAALFAFVLWVFKP